MDEALRVTFEYDDKRIELRAIRRVAMRVPPSQPAPRERTAGQAVELRDADGKVLYRRHGEIIPRFLEYPTGNADQPFGRAPVRRRQITSVLVPVHENARSVVVVEGRPPTGRAKRAARPAELVTVDLDAEHYEER
jgi:hypothetical protein